MSETSTLLSEAHFRYIAEHTAPEDPFLRELKEAARAAGIPSIWIAPEQASLMQVLLKLSKAREVIEVGTLAGYSAIAMARALPPDGRVRTIEINRDYAAFAEKWIAKSDVAGKIEVIVGPGKDVLAKVPNRWADAAFLDADKASYYAYLDACERILRPGGLVMVDNAFAFGQLFDDHPTDKEVGAVKAFNEYMASRKSFQSVIVPIGDGLWVGALR